MNRRYRFGNAGYRLAGGLLSIWDRTQIYLYGPGGGTRLTAQNGLPSVPKSMPEMMLVTTGGSLPAAGLALTRARVEPDHPIVSVIVSTRNHAGSVGRTVDAVMRQDVDVELEMIVVDNASTDDTAAVMAEAVERAHRPLTYVRLASDRGPAGGRNVGLDLAKGEFIAFTDSDCIPNAGWLRAALVAFSSPEIGVVQGQTKGEGVSQPFFSHYIETLRMDGSFSTSNVIYRRKAIGSIRFDPACVYWEDVDLGWRVLAQGWSAHFAGDALIEHVAIPLTPVQWMLWQRRLANYPAKAGRYPGFRRFLFLRVWVDPLHFWFDVALVGMVIAPWKPISLLLAIPYAVIFAMKRGLRGKFPPAKLVAHITWDFVGFGSLVAGSIRYRSLVL